MLKYEIIVRGTAAKQIKRLPTDYFDLVQQHIEGLEEQPRPPGCKKLRGDAGYSLRVGVYRILYVIDDQAQTVTIYRVKHRREVYRGL
jgi:mRNA interferase RelE/StbE